MRVFMCVCPCVCALQVEEALAAIKGVRRRQRMRNTAVLLFTDWREVWLQVRHGKGGR